MANIHPTQVRSIDPFAEYNSNANNELTRMISHGNNCLLTGHLDLGYSNYHVLNLFPGYLIKDDVLISIVDESYTIDFLDPDFYTDRNPFDETGYYYVVVSYTYVKQKPAPEASIIILKPSQIETLYTPDNFVLLKVARVEFVSTRNEITTLHNFDPTNINNGRVYAETFIGCKTVLPDFNERQNKYQLSYDVSTGQAYIGCDYGWVEITDNGVYFCDTRECQVGDLAFIGADNIAYPAIATSDMTFATGIVLSIGEHGKFKLSGRIGNGRLQPGSSAVAGDMLYLSNSSEGTATEIEPSEFIQPIGICITRTGDTYSTLSIFGYIANSGSMHHNSLFGLQGGNLTERYHLSEQQYNNISGYSGYHNSMTGIQGGDVTERYHINESEYEAIHTANSSGFSGYHNGLPGMQGGTSNQRYHLSHEQYTYVSGFSGKHNFLDDIQGGNEDERYHLDETQYNYVSAYSGYHNLTNGLQGGSQTERYHLSSAQYNYVSAYSGYHNLTNGLQGGNINQRYHLDADQYNKIIAYSGYHNSLTALQGGFGEERYHLTKAEWEGIHASSGFSGYHNSLPGLQGGDLAERYHITHFQYENIATTDDGDGYKIPVYSPANSQHFMPGSGEYGVRITDVGHLNAGGPIRAKYRTSGHMANLDSDDNGAFISDFLDNTQTRAVHVKDIVISSTDENDNRLALIANNGKRIIGCNFEVENFEDGQALRFVYDDIPSQKDRIEFVYPDISDLEYPYMKLMGNVISWCDFTDESKSTSAGSIYSHPTRKTIVLNSAGVREVPVDMIATSNAGDSAQSHIAGFSSTGHGKEITAGEILTEDVVYSTEDSHSGSIMTCWTGTGNQLTDSNVLANRNGTDSVGIGIMNPNIVGASAVISTKNETGRMALGDNFEEKLLMHLVQNQGTVSSGSLAMFNTNSTNIQDSGLGYLRVGDAVDKVANSEVTENELALLHAQKFGMVPVGSIIAFINGYFVANNSFHNVLCDNTVSGVNAYLETIYGTGCWRVCDGSEVNDPESPIYNGTGRLLPTLTDERYLEGYLGAGYRGGANEHSHYVTGGHYHQISTTGHKHDLSMSQERGNMAAMWAFDPFSWGAASTQMGSLKFGDDQRSVNLERLMTLGSGNLGTINTDSSSISTYTNSHDNVPQYLDVFYIIRIK
jgi:hypothetical protein